MKLLHRFLLRFSGFSRNLKLHPHASSASSSTVLTPSSGHVGMTEDLIKHKLLKLHLGMVINDTLVCLDAFHLILNGHIHSNLHLS